MTPRCHFCKRPVAGGPCIWTVLTPQAVSIDEVRIGEQVRLIMGGAVYRLEMASRFVRADGPAVVLGLLHLSRGECFLNYRRVESFVYADRPDQCCKLTCERHQREIAPDRVWCMDHWRSWEAAA